MKKLLLLILLLSSRINCYSQGINVDSLMTAMPDMGDNICISSIIPDESIYPKEALNNLYSNMDRLLSSNGILSLKEDVRFFLATNYNVISKDIIPGIPSRISETVQFNFIIGDALSEQVFSSIAVQVKGVGINENKALINAIQAVKWKNEDLKEFVIEAKKKIIKYYTAEAPSMFKKADLLSKTGKYQEAMGLLISIPTACPLYKESMRKALLIYQNMIDNQAEALLRKARSAWASSPDRNGAEKAVVFLDSIPSETNYEKEINQFLSDINNRVLAIDKQKWEFQKQQYSDSIRHLKEEERAAKMKEYAANHPQPSKTFKRNIESGSNTNSYSYSNTNSNSNNGKGLFGNLVDKWNAQPTWKKVLIGGGDRRCGGRCSFSFHCFKCSWSVTF